VEGERIRIYVTNDCRSRPRSTGMHLLPNGMDGGGGLTQRTQGRETAKYEWTLRQHGSFMFHSHHDEMTRWGWG